MAQKLVNGISRELSIETAKRITGYNPKRAIIYVPGHLTLLSDNKHFFPEKYERYALNSSSMQKLSLTAVFEPEGKIELIKEKGKNDFAMYVEDPESILQPYVEDLVAFVQSQKDNYPVKVLEAEVTPTTVRRIKRFVEPATFKTLETIAKEGKVSVADLDSKVDEIRMLRATAELSKMGITFSDYEERKRDDEPFLVVVHHLSPEFQELKEFL